MLSTTIDYFVASSHNANKAMTCCPRLLLLIARTHMQRDFHLQVVLVVLTACNVVLCDQPKLHMKITAAHIQHNWCVQFYWKRKHVGAVIMIRQLVSHIWHYSIVYKLYIHWCAPAGGTDCDPGKSALVDAHH
jgi:hypothetical protein